MRRGDTCAGEDEEDMNDGQHSARLLELTRGCKGQRHLLVTRSEERAFWADRNARAKALWSGEAKMCSVLGPEGSQYGWKERRHRGGQVGVGGAVAHGGPEAGTSQTAATHKDLFPAEKAALASPDRSC